MSPSAGSSVHEKLGAPLRGIEPLHKNNDWRRAGEDPRCEVGFSQLLRQYAGAAGVHHTPDCGSAAHASAHGDGPLCFQSLGLGWIDDDREIAHGELEKFLEAVARCRSEERRVTRPIR